MLDGGFAAGFADLCHPGRPCIRVSSYHVGAAADSRCDAEACGAAAAAAGCRSEGREGRVSRLYQVGWVAGGLL